MPMETLKFQVTRISEINLIKIISKYELFSQKFHICTFAIEKKIHIITVGSRDAYKIHLN